MKMLPKYTKVLTLGASRTERALLGEVVLQEKVDGSQFRFGINEDGEVLCGSKAVSFEPGHCEKMFKPAVDYVESIEDEIRHDFHTDTYFFCEYLQKTKHNVLNYERIPKNHLVLFDVFHRGEWLSEDRKALEVHAVTLGIDVAPELWRGEIEMQRVGAGEKFDRTKGYTGLDFLKNTIHSNLSFLGGVQIEGVVIKNYKESIDVGGVIFPLFTKYVREEYKEAHNSEWKSRSPKGSMQEYFDGFCNEARWQKAVQHLKDKGELEQSPRDIGNLIKEVQNDIKSEEIDNIKDFLYKNFIKDIIRRSVRGLPEWYKELLITENVEGG
jgi:hypothetical protein